MPTLWLQRYSAITLCALGAFPAGAGVTCGVALEFGDDLARAELVGQAVEGQPDDGTAGGIHPWPDRTGGGAHSFEVSVCGLVEVDRDLREVTGGRLCGAGELAAMRAKAGITGAETRDRADGLSPW